MEILCTNRLSYTHRSTNKKALDDISFSLRQGDFALLYGKSGSGKSTLLRLLKPGLTMTGERGGTISLFGDEIPPFRSDTEYRPPHTFRVGFVAQNPKHQIITDRVWQELSFGAESMGMDVSEMRFRIAELACYFGLEKRFLDSTQSLSGGGAQILNLAAAMATDPELLILDEPTAQLDPIGAENFLSLLSRIHREMGVTILLSEHRTDAVLPLANRLLVLENGKLIADDSPKEAIRSISALPHLLHGMPASVRLSRALDLPNPCPLTVGETRQALSEKTQLRSLPGKLMPNGEVALHMKDVHFGYEKNLPKVLSGLDLSLRYGEVHCLLGGNGSGKSTALAIAKGLYKPLHGKIFIDGKPLKFGQILPNSPLLLMQDVSTVFTASTAKEELERAGCDISDLPWSLDFDLSTHPFDLSGGEQQLLALSVLFAKKPKILLLDEVTKGLDRFSVQIVGNAIRELSRLGCAVMIVTHDQEFAAEHSDRVSFLFRGGIVSTLPAREFFAKGRFYTTPTRIQTRHLLPDAVTVDDAVYCLSQSGEDPL